MLYPNVFAKWTTLFSFQCNLTCLNEDASIAGENTRRPTPKRERYHQTSYPAKKKFRTNLQHPRLLQYISSRTFLRETFLSNKADVHALRAKLTDQSPSRNWGRWKKEGGKKSSWGQCSAPSTRRDLSLIREKKRGKLSSFPFFFFPGSHFHFRRFGEREKYFSMRGMKSSVWFSKS